MFGHLTFLTNLFDDFLGDCNVIEVLLTNMNSKNAINAN